MKRCVKCKCGGTLIANLYYEHIEGELLSDLISRISSGRGRKIFIHICDKCGKNKLYKKINQNNPPQTNRRSKLICMEKPKTLQEIEKLFEEKFKYTGEPKMVEPCERLDYYQTEAVKQFWLEHTRALLESVRMEEQTVPEPDYDNWEKVEGYNEAVRKVNNQIQFLLSEGGENN